MKTRMEKYVKDSDITPRREQKNTFLYDEIYDEKKEPTSNITLLDNVNEIDINKIKEMMKSRETYKRSREYKDIIGEKQEKIQSTNYEFNEPEVKDYDINELIKKKKDGTEIEEDKIRKISNTQYDILKGLTLNESDSEFFTQEKELSTIMKKIVDKNTEDRTLDLFGELKGNDEEDLTPEVISKHIESKSKFNTFEFEKGDFEDIIAPKKNEMSFTLKIILIFIISIAIVIGIFYLLSQYMTNAS
jgi:hypothetical protein